MSSPLDESLVPFERLAKFIRQLTHDVRNGLSAIDLEAAFVAELVTDSETADEVRKLREMVTNTARMLKDISGYFQPVTIHPAVWPAGEFVEELEARIEKQFPDECKAGVLRAESRVNGESIEIDLEQLANSVLHVIQNAFQFGKEEARVRFSSFREGDDLVFEVREAKPDFQSQVPPQDWGVAPMITTRSGGYGLGLFRVRQVLDAHGGKFGANYHEGTLITRLSVPVWRDSGA